MSDVVLLIAGVVIFSITTVSTLWFGYSRFFVWYALSPDGPSAAGDDPGAPGPQDLATAAIDARTAT